MSEKYFDLSGVVDVYNPRGAFIVTLYTEVILNCADKLYKLTQHEKVCELFRAINVPMEVNVKTLRETISELEEKWVDEMLSTADMDALEKEFNIFLFTMNLIERQFEGTRLKLMLSGLDDDFIRDMDMRIQLLYTAVDLYKENLNQAIVEGNKFITELKAKERENAEFDEE